MLKEGVVAGKLQTSNPDQLAWRRSNPVLLRRCERGWTRRKLARKCGLSEQGIYKIEAGLRSPRAVTVAALARRLRIHPLTLLWKILLWWKQGPGSGAVDLDRPSLRLAFRRDERILRLHELGYLDAVAQMAGEANPKTELGQWILLRLLDAGLLRTALDIVEQQGESGTGDSLMSV